MNFELEYEQAHYTAECEAKLIICRLRELKPLNEKDLRNYSQALKALKRATELEVNGH